MKRVGDYTGSMGCLSISDMGSNMEEKGMQKRFRDPRITPINIAGLPLIRKRKGRPAIMQIVL